MKEKTEKAKELLLSKPCEVCGKPNATYTTDPYGSEIRGDYTKHWLCDACIDESNMEI